MLELLTDALVSLLESLGFGSEPGVVALDNALLQRLRLGGLCQLLQENDMEVIELHLWPHQGCDIPEVSDQWVVR